MHNFCLGGTFVYTVGPKTITRLSTISFKLYKNIYFMFAYHKISKNVELRLLVKREDSNNEDLLFEVIILK